MNPRPYAALSAHQLVRGEESPVDAMCMLWAFLKAAPAITKSFS